MKVITLIGADASGKDTQIALLKKHFENQNKKVQVVTIWDSLAEFSLVDDKKSLQEIVETFLLKYEAHSRSFFLLACLKNAISKVDTNNDIILLNGFYHKYWGSEMSYGVESLFWEKNISEFLSSDKIIYLKTSVEQCLSRKAFWSKYEQGLAKFVDQNKNQTKEEFQRDLHKNLDIIALGINNIAIVDGAGSIDKVFSEILREI